MDRLFRRLRIAPSSLEKIAKEGYSSKEVLQADEPVEGLSKTSYTVSFEIIERALELADGDSSRIIIDNYDGSATVYNTADLAIEALIRGNATNPKRFSKI
jgi:hypothetical protein